MSWPVLRLRLQTGGHDGGQRRIDAVHGRRTLRQLLDQSGRGCARMWRPPGQHLVQQRAQTVEVDARANLLPGELLRRHVAQRAHDHSSLGRSLQRLAQQPRDAEVDEPGVAIGPDQDVPGLDVAVDHAARVSVVQGLRDLCADLGSGPRLQRSLALQERGERLTIHQLEHDRGPIARIRGQHPNDPRMVEAPDGARLRREPGARRGIRQ